MRLKGYTDIKQEFPLKKIPYKLSSIIVHIIVYRYIQVQYIYIYTYHSIYIEIKRIYNMHDI